MKTREEGRINGAREAGADGTRAGTADSQAGKKGKRKQAG